MEELDPLIDLFLIEGSYLLKKYITYLLAILKPPAGSCALGHGVNNFVLFIEGFNIF